MRRCVVHLCVALFAMYVGVGAVGRRSPAPAHAPAIAPSPAPAPAHAPAIAPAAPDVEHGVPPVCYVASPSLEKFIEPLTFSPVVDVSHGQHLTIGAYKISQKLHRDLPNTTLYAFGTSQETAVFPGPTLMARRYVPAHVRWENHIQDEHHFLPVSTAIEWANPTKGGVPIVVHLHGAEVPSIYDGNPDAWITAKNETGRAFVTQDYIYPNRQTPTALWYHDHTMGITRLNVMAGLSGMYILQPTQEEEGMLGLPNGAPLVFKDFRFYSNGSINMPSGDINEPVTWCPEWSDVWVVNGKVWPLLRVFAKPYRFRMLNACNARTTSLYLSDGNVHFLQIGTHGGYLSEPRLVDDYLLLSPGERADCIVDFSGLDNQAEVLLQNAPIDPDNTFYFFTGPETHVIMKFTVVDEDGLQEGLVDRPDYLAKLTPYMRETSSSPVENKVEAMEPLVREIATMPSMVGGDEGRVYQYIINNVTWNDPVDIVPTVGRFEVWEVYNLYWINHNFHLHLVQFQVLNEQAFDATAARNNECSMRIPYPENGTCFQGYPQSPVSYYQGWKDTFFLRGNSMVRILIHFAPRDGGSFSFNPTEGPGYVLHCHIVQHEDHSMMRPYRLHYDDTVRDDALK